MFTDSATLCYARVTHGVEFRFAQLSKLTVQSGQAV